MVLCPRYGPLDHAQPKPLCTARTEKCAPPPRSRGIGTRPDLAGHDFSAHYPWREVGGRDHLSPGSGARIPGTPDGTPKNRVHKRDADREEIAELLRCGLLQPLTTMPDLPFTLCEFKHS